MGKNVVAIVVSHNRAELLTRCIDNLQKQSYQIKRILIVDNGSEPNVIELLEKLKISIVQMDVLYQENLGSAGGLANGIKHALNKYGDLDFLWLMDDDGYPTENALKELVEASALFDGAILNTFVVSDLLTKKMSFPFYHGIDKKLEEDKEIKYFVNKANFFNGTFIPKSVMGRLGVPIAKLFVKGDELEYYERALMKLRIPMVTVRDSVFVHPSNDESLSSDISKDKIWHIYFNLRNFFYSHRFDSNITENEKIRWIIRLFKYYKYWRNFKRDLMVNQFSNRKLKIRILNLALWHVITDKFNIKPSNIKSKLK